MQATRRARLGKSANERSQRWFWNPIACHRLRTDSTSQYQAPSFFLSFSLCSFRTALVSLSLSLSLRPDAGAPWRVPVADRRPQANRFYAKLKQRSDISHPGNTNEVRPSDDSFVIEPFMHFAGEPINSLDRVKGGWSILKRRIIMFFINKSKRAQRPLTSQ